MIKVLLSAAVARLNINYQQADFSRGNLAKSQFAHLRIMRRYCWLPSLSELGVIMFKNRPYVSWCLGTLPSLACRRLNVFMR